MDNIAVFPGSFDPITLGHTDLLDRALPLFDKVVVAVGKNSKKQSLYPLEKRMEMLHQLFGAKDNIEIASYEGLTVDFCKEVGAGFILRGLRAMSDFDYEKTIAQLNQTLNADIETVCFMSRPQFAHISSSIVREIITNGGDYSKFVPPGLDLSS